MKDKIMVTVSRFNPTKDLRPKPQKYVVPCEGKMSVLQVMRYIYKRLDQTLAFRNYQCYKGVCGACMVNLNGKPVRACHTLVEPGKEITIEPVRGYRLIRDLAVDFKEIIKKTE